MELVKKMEEYKREYGPHLRGTHHPTKGYYTRKGGSQQQVCCMVQILIYPHLISRNYGLFVYGHW